MKLGVDIRVLMDEHYSGVSQYAANLLNAILKHDTTGDYRLFYNSWHRLEDRLSSFKRDNSELIAWHIPNKIFNYVLERVLHYPKLDKVTGSEVFWSPHFNFSSFRRNSRHIITVHDLSFLRYPGFFSRRKNLWHRLLGVKATLRRADHIIAVSENTKREIKDLVGISDDKVSVIYSGNNLSKMEPDESVIDSSGLTQYVLFVGTIEPRKNILGLIKAFEMLKATDRYPDLKLVLAGGKGWKSAPIYAAREESFERENIIFTGYVTEKQRLALYSRAKLFVYPSFYEGFGFPPLEAMSCGIPVVSSAVSSLPEVVGDAALLVDPYQTEEMSRAIEAVLDDEALRARMIEKGKQQSARFSWDKAALQYLEIFKKFEKSGS